MMVRRTFFLAILFALPLALAARAQTPAAQLEDADGATLWQLNDDGGFAVFGEYNTGTIPIEGAGTRLMWYPEKAAFRAGRVFGSQWNDENVGLESIALSFNSTASGNYSTAIGAGTEASGSHSTAVGGYTTASASRSTAMGDGTEASGIASTAMGNVTTASGAGATAMGNYTEASGNTSTAMGTNTEASGNYSTVMGRRTIAATESSLSIGAYNDANTSADGTLFVAGNGTSTSRSDALVLDETGNLTITGTLTESSDRRLKTAVAPLEAGVLERLAAIQPVRYRFREGTGHPTDEQIGLIAQEVRQHFPELVTEGADGYLALSYTKLTAVLVKGLQEQQAQIEALRSENETIRQRLAKLEAQHDSALAGLGGAVPLGVLLGAMVLGGVVLVRRRRPQGPQRGRVAQGTYAPGTDPSATFTLPDGVALYGGFPDGGGAFEERDFSVHETILTGDIDGNDSGDINAIITADGTDATTRLDGFTISDAAGHGVFLTGSSLSLAHLSIADNLSGGLYAAASDSLAFANVTFTGNISPVKGGAMNLYNSQASLINVIFTNNENDSEGGGAIRLVASQATFVNVNFTGNVSAAWGGAIALDEYSQTTLINAAFTENEADPLSGGAGGAIYVGGDSDIRLFNTTLADNQAGTGGAMYTSGASHVELVNSILWNNTDGGGSPDQVTLSGSSTLEASHNLLEGGLTDVDGGGTIVDNGGNINGDPLFIGDASCLSPASPVVNAGDGNLPADTYDLDNDGDTSEAIPHDVNGHPRLAGSTVDIGAYEVRDAHSCGPSPKSPMYVDDTAAGANTGTSWADAFADLQDALDAATTGDQIWVAAGTYVPGSHPDDVFQLPGGVVLYGGFPDGGGAFDQRDFSAHETVLSGEINGDGGFGETYTIIEVDGVDASTRLDGCTITGSRDQAMRVTNGRPALTNLTFHTNLNTENAWAAGLYISDSSPTLTNVTFRGNVATYGAALYVTGESSVTIVNSVFTGNESFSDGGAIFVDAGSDVRLINGTLRGNDATSAGGAFYATAGSSITLTNSILWNNTAGSGGNQIYLDGGVLEARSSLLEGSLAAVDGGGTVVDGGGNLSGDPLFVDVDSGNLRLQAGSPALDAGDETLLPADAFDFDGDGRLVSERLTSDRDLTLRVEGAAVDLGAFEAGGGALPVELTALTATRDGAAVVLRWTTASETNNAGFEVQAREHGRASAWERLGFVEGAGTTSKAQSYAFTAEGLDVGTYAFRLKQIDRDGTAHYSGEVEVAYELGRPYVVAAPYPNPARGAATLELTVREKQHVTVAVYDALGRRVATLYDGELPANRTEQIRFGDDRLPSGLYLVRAVGEGFAVTRRVTLVR